jgi:myo-inositol-1(or 4)-monophosphatase
MTDIELICNAALEAGRLALTLRDRGLIISHKADGSPVTNGDLAVDELLKTTLGARRPDYGWLSEESADSADRLDRKCVFVVDPIDGTSAYLGGKPWFVVCIAIVEAARPVAAVIYAPATDELYRAVDGGGAWCNGSVMAAADVTTLHACRMLGDVKLFKRPCPGKAWPQMQVERRNAIAYRMALVGAGAFDAAVSPGWKHDWDLAAGDLIAREAGALVTDTQGGQLVFNTPQARNLGMICAAPALHPLILKRTAPIDQLQA